MGKKPKVIDPLAQVKSNPAKVTSLMLNPAASRNAGQGLYDPLPKWPVEIFACKNLVDLEIFRGLEDGTIPRDIGTLKKLTSLTLGGLDTRQLPPEIGQLTNLESLRLPYMEMLTSIPASIGKLSKLRELLLHTAAKTLPPTIGDLKSLRLFTVSEIVEVHANLWKCTALEELHLPESATMLPGGIGALAKLKKLTLSPSALASIAGELPKLKSLAELRVVGDYSGDTASRLPDEIGQLKNLTSLTANYLGLTSLPSSIARLGKLALLEVAGNRLSTMIDVVAQLTKLESLDFSSNPVAVSERRELDKLMKLSPAKRAAALAKRAPAKAAAPEKPKAKPAKPKPKKKAAKPERLGQVASINASLSLIIADQRVAKDWSGIGEGDDLDGSDWERARQALSKKDYAMLDVGKQSAVALSLGVGQGVADVFRVGDRIVVVESIANDTEDELFLEYVASAPQKPRSVANLAVPSKKLVMVPTTDAGDGEESFEVDVPVKIAISIEPEAQSSWGTARRFFVTPV